MSRGVGTVSTRLLDDERLSTDMAGFEQLRARLFGIAYRIVGNVQEAEDVLQEVWLRWQRADRTAVVSAEAFLVTATTRLAINVVQSARRRHETYVALWRDEAAVDRDADPWTGAERGEAIALAIKVLVERLPPAERAAFVLREGFEYPYQQIARVLQIGTANARQLVSRARTRIATGCRRSSASTAPPRLLRAFAAASRRGELAGLEALLAADLKRAG